MKKEEDYDGKDRALVGEVAIFDHFCPFLDSGSIQKGGACYGLIFSISASRAASAFAA